MGDVVGTAAPHRRRGFSVRLKLALSYAAFLLVAWALFAVVLFLVLRFLPDENLVVANGSGFVPNRSDLIAVATPLVLYGTAILAVVGCVGGWFLAGWMLRPLASITAAAEAVAGGSLAARADLPGPDDEIRRLADAFDEMVAWVESSFAEQRRFTSNASHELRTPLAVTKTMLEVAQSGGSQGDTRQLIARLSEMNNRSIETIDSLLRLAEVGRTALHREHTDLAVVVRLVVHSLETEARQRGIRVETDLRPATLVGDRALLGRLVDNLLTNAYRHNLAEGGHVRATTGVASDGRSFVRIDNTGVPVDPVSLPTAVEPFVRLGGRIRSTGSPTGSGLGLSIVSSIVRAHDGQLTLHARSDGGLTATVSLPSG